MAGTQNEAAASDKGYANGNQVGTEENRNFDKKFIQDIDNDLKKMGVAIEELGHALAPWTVASNKKKSQTCQAQMDKNRNNVIKLLNQTLEKYESLESHAKSVRSDDQKLRNLEENERLLTARGQEFVQKEQYYEEELQRLSKELQDTQSELKKATTKPPEEPKQDQPDVSQSQSLRQSQNGIAFMSSSKRFIKPEEKQEMELLQARINTLLDDYGKLQADLDRANKSKTELSRKTKDQESKLQEECGSRDREIRRLQAELKRADDRRESDILSTRMDMQKQADAKFKEMRMLQRRLDATRGEIEGYQARDKTWRIQMDEANAQLAKAVEDGRTHARKAADARFAREDVTKSLTVVQKEYAFLGEEFEKLEQQVVKASGFQALPYAARLTNQNTLPFPRRAYTTRGGKVLHNCSCDMGVDVLKMDPREYKSVEELQDMIVGRGLVPCTLCAQMLAF